MAGTATTVQSAMDAKMPDANSFLAGAILTLGLHTAGHFSGRTFIPTEQARRVQANLQKAYVQTGVPPWELAAKAAGDPVMRQELLDQDIHGDPVLTKHNAYGNPEPEPYAPPRNGINEKFQAALKEGDQEQQRAQFGQRQPAPIKFHQEFAAVGRQIAPTGNEAVDNFMPLMSRAEGSVDTSVSPKGAVGRFQIMVPTARQYGFGAGMTDVQLAQKLHEADFNETVAKTVAADLGRRSNGDLAAMAVGYNAGPARMSEYLAAGSGTRLEAVRDPTIKGGLRYDKVDAPKDESFLPLETQKYLAGIRLRAGGDIKFDAGGGEAPFEAPAEQSSGPSAELEAEAAEQDKERAGEEKDQASAALEGSSPGSGGAANAWEGAEWKDIQDEILSNIGEQPQQQFLDKSQIARQFFSELAPARAIDDRLIARGDYNRIQQMGFEDYLRQTYASDARAGVFARYGIVDAATKEIEPESPSFLTATKQFQADGGDAQGFKAFLMARRTAEKQAQGIDTGVNQLAAIEGARNAEANAKYGKAAEIWGKVNDGFLRYMRDSGMISQKQVEAMQGANSTYVSFRRLRGDDAAFTPKGRGFGVSQTLRRMEGSDRQIVDPLLATLDNQRVGIQMADRNQARLYIVNRALADPNIAADLGLQKIARVDPNYDEIDSALKSYGFKDEDLNKAREAYEPLIAARAEKNLAGNEFLVYRDGQAEKWSVSDPDFARLLRSADSVGEANILTKTLQTFAAAQRTGIVLQPDFPGRMTLWHQFNQFVMDPLHPPPVFTWLRGIGHVLGQDEMYQRAVAKGALGAAMVDMDRNWLAQDMNATFQQTGTWDAVKNMVSHPLELAQLVSEKLDAANRVGYMAQAEAKGIESVKAATMARKSGLDYAERATSQIVNNMSKYAAFFRPHLLGMKQGWEAFADNGDGKGQFGNAAITVAHAVAAISIPMAAMYALNYLNDKNMPDGQKYSDLPRWERDTMLITPPVAGVRLKLRLPANFGFPFGGFVNRMMDSMVAHDPAAFEGWAHDFLQEYVPNPTPTMVQPAAEVVANHNFFSGKPLVPDSLKQASPDMQYFDTTTAPAKALAHYLNIGLRTLNVDQVSPIAVEHLVSGWGGPMGMGALAILNAPFAKPGPPMDVSDIPFVKGFVVRNPGSNAQPIEDFYNKMQEFQAAHTDFSLAMKHAQETGDDADLSTVQSAMSDPKVFTNMRDLAETSKAINMQRSVLYGIYGNKQMTTQEKRQAIEDVYSQMVLTAKLGNMLMEASDGSAS